MEWQKVLEEPETVLSLDKVTLQDVPLELQEKNGHGLLASRLAAKPFLLHAANSPFFYDARDIQDFSIFAPLTDLNLVLPVGTWQSIPLKDCKVKHFSVNSLILMCINWKSPWAVFGAHVAHTLLSNTLSVLLFAFPHLSHSYSYAFEANL